MKGFGLEFYFLNKVVSQPWFPAVGNLLQIDVVVYACAKNTSSLTRYLLFLLFVGCPSLLYVVVGSYPINIRKNENTLQL